LIYLRQHFVIALCGVLGFVLGAGRAAHGGHVLGVSPGPLGLCGQVPCVAGIEMQARDTVLNDLAAGSARFSLLYDSRRHLILRSLRVRMTCRHLLRLRVRRTGTTPVFHLQIRLPISRFNLRLKLAFGNSAGELVALCP
jgi:hypothetical protein